MMDALIAFIIVGALIAFIIVLAWSHPGSDQDH